VNQWPSFCWIEELSPGVDPTTPHHPSTWQRLDPVPFGAHEPLSDTAPRIANRARDSRLFGRSR
jgi:hypothetical protein